jgi:hypothetical protein
MSTDDAAATQRDSGIDWLLGIRFFLLTFTIAGILGNAVTVSWWARLALDNLAAINAWIRDALSALLVNWFHVQIDPVIEQSLPIIAALMAVVVIGLGRAQLKHEPLGKIIRPSWIALLLVVVLTGLQAFYGSTPTDEVKAYRTLQSRCFSSVPFSDESNRHCSRLYELDQSRAKKQTFVDLGLTVLYVLLMWTVGLLFPTELIAATVAACLFLTLGMIDFRWVMGPS